MINNISGGLAMYTVEKVMEEFMHLKGEEAETIQVVNDEQINSLNISSAAKAVIRHLVIMEMSEAERHLGTTYLCTTMNQSMYDELEYTVEKYINKNTPIEETCYDLFVHSCGILQFYGKHDERNYIVVHESKVIEQLEMSDIAEHHNGDIPSGVDIIHGELRRILDNFGSTTAIRDYLKKSGK